ncbi:hypothetical protein N7494_009486 [Penicillium frequentans]|uniref:Uncharacterized protein n=1 Tax=Penicillium frequentans TaxID=3151616 RepID=A0AAD6CRT0_9EURO|nr:hypothetical protein N7494_009486 [Penicillium glabrum]
MANDHGASLFESLEQMKEEIRDLRQELQEVKTELQEVKTELQDVKVELSEVRESMMNIRERNYLTFLRDHVTGFNRTHENCICILNSSEVHGGDALLDASMFLSRRNHFLEERRLFQRIYGLSAEKLQEFREFYLPNSREL